MSERIISWLNLNQYRAYPLVEDYTTITNFSDTFIVDFSLFSFVEDSLDIKLVSIEYVAETTPTIAYTYVFNFSHGDSLFSMAVPRLSLSALTDEFLTVQASSHYRCCELTVSRTILDLDSMYFPLTINANIEPCLIKIYNKHRANVLRGLNELDQYFITKEQLTTNYGPTYDLTGDVRIKSGHSVAVRQYENSLIFNTVKGEGIGKFSGLPCAEFTDVENKCKDVIMFINDAKPTKNGEIELTGGDGITIGKGESDDILIIASSVNPEKPTCK